jgi:ADP-ribose pyrophosphatase YjhB (NUDIX family)
MKRILLCTGILRRGDGVLLVRCRYAGEPQPLWVLPGGRHEHGETIAQTVAREFHEETGLRITTTSIAYASESIDEHRGLHVVNFTFFVEEEDPNASPQPKDPSVVEARFVPAAQAPALLNADVLRIPVAAALSGADAAHYFAFKANDVAVPFLSGPPGALDV